MNAIDLTKFKGVILTDGKNPLNNQFLKLTGEEYSSHSFENIGNCYIRHIKTGNIYYVVPKSFLLTK